MRRYDEDQFYRAENRYAQAKSANRGIEEAQDASSYLVPPEPPTSEIDNMRWSAGVLLGSVDWVFEQLFGWSLLNDLIY
ncbi:MULTISPECIES: hypothetical protein [unclassified Actinomyces]|uniref:hypothetical protein n=1 Tax=unclassified Actinomyces TaxID=2609248 RepID=UPI000D592E9C|nr:MULTISPECIES: hypothetical protein [unclassified Actinomyces]RAX22946.1 hypothetical protein DRB07_06445 [Actinomyces sp. Z3]RAX24623.1 hypothetical protein DRB06_00750 [Actinomyces sp. Z5]